MSRIGNALITIPNGVTVEIKEGGIYGNQEVVVTGPKGTLTEALRPGVKVEVVDGTVKLTRANNLKQTRSHHGLYRSLINNMVKGVFEGYKRELQIVGIGYRAENQGDKIVFSLGYSHKIEYKVPEGITVDIQNQTDVSVMGINKQLVGEVAAKIRSFRKPEPYKGKGVRFKDEQIKRKSVKKGA